MKIRQVDIKGEVYDIEAYENPIPTGSVLPFAGIAAPEGFLLCNGQEVSRFTYAKLYGVLGDTYGAGDGSTTFNLPNLIDKFIQGGQNIGEVKEAGLPNIEGRVSFPDACPRDGAFKWTSFGSESFSLKGGTTGSALRFDASQSNIIYGKSTTVQPPAVVMNYIIKD